MPTATPAVSLISIAELDATEFLSDGCAALTNWRWCDDHATFAHREAAEFLIWVGQEADTWPLFVRQLQDYGCSDAFVAALSAAHDAGVRYALLYS